MEARLGDEAAEKIIGVVVDVCEGGGTDLLRLELSDDEEGDEVEVEVEDEEAAAAAAAAISTSPRRRQRKAAPSVPPALLLLPGRQQLRERGRIIMHRRINLQPFIIHIPPSSSSSSSSSTSLSSTCRRCCFRCS